MVKRLVAVSALAFGLGWAAFGGALAMADSSSTANTATASDVAQIQQNIADGNVQPVHRISSNSTSAVSPDALVNSYIWWGQNGYSPFTLYGNPNTAQASNIVSIPSVQNGYQDVDAGGSSPASAGGTGQYTLSLGQYNPSTGARTILMTGYYPYGWSNQYQYGYQDYYATGGEYYVVGQNIANNPTVTSEGNDSVYN